MALASALQIVRDAYNASERTDIGYYVDPAGVEFFDDASSLYIKNAYKWGEHTGYTWATWAAPPIEDYWDEGGSDSEADARAHVAAWLMAGEHA